MAAKICTVLGAHSGDDLEIGCGGATLLRWLARGAELHLTWVSALASAPGRRGAARALMKGAAGLEIVIGDFADAVPGRAAAWLKAFLAELVERVSPDLVLTGAGDRHRTARWPS